LAPVYRGSARRAVGPLVTAAPIGYYRYFDCRGMGWTHDETSTVAVHFVGYFYTPVRYFVRRLPKVPLWWVLCLFLIFVMPPFKQVRL